MITERSSTKVNLQGEARVLIKEEANLLGISMSKILRDYTLEYIKLKHEAKIAKEGKLAEGSILHTFISNMEARIANSIDGSQKEILSLKQEVQVITAIIDNFVKLYLNHTQEVPISERAERIQSSLYRYQKFLAAVKSTLIAGNDNFITKIQNLVLNELEA